jgi:signal transduction histidine kinase
MNERIKDLETKLASLFNDKEKIIEKIDLLNELSWELKISDTKRALQLSTEAYELSKNISYQKGLAYSLRSQGYSNSFLSNYDIALSQSFEALNLFQKIKDKYGESSVLNAIGNVYNRLGNYSEALEYYSKGLKIQQEIEHKQGEAYTLNNIGNVYHGMGDYAKALECHLKSLKIKEDIEDFQGQSASLNNIGIVYEKLCDYPSALEYYVKSLKIRETIGDKYGEAATLANIGNIHKMLGNYQNALDYYFKSLKMFEDVGDRQSQVISLNNIGGVYNKLEGYANALDYHFKGLKIQEEIGDKSGQGQSLNDIGSVYAKLNDYKNALNYYSKGLNILQEIGNKEGECISLLGIGTIYIEQKEVNKSIEYLEKALSIAEEIKSKQLIYESHNALSEGHELNGNFAKALEHHKAFYRFKEKVFNEEADKKTKSLIIQFEVEKSQREAEIYRLKNVELAQANESLRKINELKTELLSIAAHDLRNPLNAIKGLADVIRQEVNDQKSVIESSDLIYRSSQRMLHLISELLQTAAIESGKLTLNYKKVNVNDLAELVTLSNKQYANQKGQNLILLKEQNVDCTVNADEGRLREAMDNLVSNAIKYSPLQKSIWITVKRIDNVVRFEVRDEGPGLTEDDRKKLFGKFQRLSARPTGDESSTGLGLSITKNLVEMQGGHIWAESEVGKGSVFIIEFPKIQ